MLHEVDFSGTNLIESAFHNCDLNGSVFSRTILDKADFRTAYNYSIDPENSRVKKAKFSAVGALGLLDKYDLIIQ